MRIVLRQIFVNVNANKLNKEQAIPDLDGKSISCGITVWKLKSSDNLSSNLCIMLNEGYEEAYFGVILVSA